MKITVYGWYEIGRNRWQIVADHRDTITKSSVGYDIVREFRGTWKEIEAEVLALNIAERDRRAAIEC